MNSSNFACCCRKFCAAGLVASFFKAEIEKWGPLIRKAGVYAD